MIGFFHNLGSVVDTFHQNHLVVDGNAGLRNFQTNLKGFGSALGVVVKVRVHVKRCVLFNDRKLHSCCHALAGEFCSEEL